MSKVERDLTAKVAKCVKKQTGVDVLADGVYAGLSGEIKASVDSTAFTCFLDELRRMRKKPFLELVEGELDRLNSDSEQVGRKVVNFLSRVGDSASLFEYLYSVTMVVKTLSEELEESDLLLDRVLALRLLLLSNINELKSKLAIGNLAPLIYTCGLAQSAIGRDTNWCVAVVTFTTEEVFLKETAAKLSIQLDGDAKYPVVLRQLTLYMEENNIRKSLNVLLDEAHRTIRNRVLHEGWTPTDDETADIVAHVSRMVSFINSEGLSPP